MLIAAKEDTIAIDIANRFVGKSRIYVHVSIVEELKQSSVIFYRKKL